jgi:hypothetical protein
MAAREMRQSTPFRLAQAERAEALVKLVTPGPGRLLNELTDGLGIDFGHR